MAAGGSWTSGAAPASSPCASPAWWTDKFRVAEAVHDMLEPGGASEAAPPPGGRANHLHPGAARLPDAAHRDALRRAVVHLMPAAQAPGRVNQSRLIG